MPIRAVITDIQNHRWKMNFMKLFLVGFMSAAMFFANTAQAMEIQLFDRMAGDDQIRYVGQLEDSVEGALKGDPALLARVKRFFLAKQPGEDLSGMGRFELNLALARIADIDTAAKNPKARRLELEDVLYVTLERNGIALPKTFRPTAANFQPKFPISPKPLTKEDAVKGEARMRAWVARTVDTPRTFRPNSHSDFSDNDKAIAFFMALAAIAVAARSSDKGSATSSGGMPVVDNRPWWQQSGFDTWGQAVHAACIGSTTSAHPNCN